MTSTVLILKHVCITRKLVSCYSFYLLFFIFLLIILLKIINFEKYTVNDVNKKFHWLFKGVLSSVPMHGFSSNFAY